MRKDQFRRLLASLDSLTSVQLSELTQAVNARHRADFEYLKNEVEPPLWVTVSLLLLSAIASVGAAVYFAHNEHRAGGRRFGAYSQRQSYSGRPGTAISCSSPGAWGWLARLGRLSRFGARVRRR